MWQTLVSAAGRLLEDFHRVWQPERRHHPPASPAAGAAVEYHPLQRVVLTDGVGRTLFEEYADHRAAARGEEETGWVLLGMRQPQQAVVLATLPAGAQRDASVTHVRFNSSGQAVGSLIVRQADRRLGMLGVVHTHPGSLRHPSDADFRGDSQWVQYLRGREGIFGIGTADARSGGGALLAEQPRPHVQCLGELRLSWYSLRHGEPNYHPLAVDVTLGPDLARPLHSVWTVIEEHAERLERLYRQQAGVTFDVAPDDKGPGLAVNVPLAEPGTSLRVLLREKETRYFLVRRGEVFAVDCLEDRVDRGVYLLLSDLAGQE